MPRRILFIVAVACALVACVLTADAASAYPVTASSLTPAWLDVGPAPTTTTTTTTTDVEAADPGIPADPPPAEDACPDRPVDTTPIAACEFDPTTYYLWTGDDADAPDWTRCNYQSLPDDELGDGENPCPHSDATTGYVRCGGHVWSVDRHDADGNDAFQANVLDVCPDGYVDLST